MSPFLGDSSGGRPRLAELLDAGDMVLAPGRYDPTRRAAASRRPGFPRGCTCTGASATAAGRLGRPDVGLFSLSEMADSRPADRTSRSAPPGDRGRRTPAMADPSQCPSGSSVRVHEFEAARGGRSSTSEDQVIAREVRASGGQACSSAPARWRPRWRRRWLARRASRRSSSSPAPTHVAVEGLVERARARPPSTRHPHADRLFVEAPQSDRARSRRITDVHLRRCAP